jgi:hypothetical protein
MLFNSRSSFATQPRPNKSPSPAMQPALPTQLSSDGRSLVYSGTGRAAGAHVYIDLARSHALDLYLVRVSSKTATHTFTAVPNNPALAVVCVANTDIPTATGVGDWLLVGPLAFDGDGLTRARHAWPLHVPAPWRLSGVVSRVHPTGRFGEIAGPNGTRLFFHISDLPPGIVPGVNLFVGQAVSYREQPTEKGLNAREVRLS